MPIVHSADGTPIAYSRIGNGPPVILVDGAMCYRAFGPAGPLATLLSERFTVFTYDRRGRGESGDSQPYAVEREIEDIDALITEAGGSACLYGISSGAALALEAANSGLAVEKLVLYEIPFIVDDTKPPIASDFIARVEDHVAANRRGDAIAMFMKFVGVPAPAIFIMRLLPAWSKLKAVAHTLPYDLSLVVKYETGEPLPAGRWASTKVPTLVADGGKSPAWMRNAMRSLAGVLPNAKYKTIDGQTHMLSAKAITPVLGEFFTGGAVA